MRGAIRLFVHVALLAANTVVFAQLDVKPAAQKSLDAALVTAAREGNLRMVSELLGRGADVNAGDTEWGYVSDTALHHAARRNDVALAELLIERGADPNARGRTGYTPLHVAAGLNRAAMAQWLIRHGAKLSMVDSVVGTPLAVAVLQGHVHLVELLINEGADVNSGKPGRTPLHMLRYAGVIRPDHGVIVRMLTKAGADLTAIDQNGDPAYVALVRRFPAIPLELAQSNYPLDYSKPPKYPLLFLLTEDPQLPALRYLLENGQSMELKAAQDRSLLHAAASNGQAKVIEYLLQRGMDINAKAENGMTPLHYAALSSREVAVIVLLAHGANPQLRNSRGNTPLLLTHLWGPVASALVASGSDVNERNNEGWSALDLAAGQNGALATKFILDHGGDAKGRDKSGLTALHRARDAAVVDLLVAAGADVNARSKEGLVPLDFVSQATVVDALVARGADPNARANDGGTPLHYATKHGYANAIDALVRHGADLNAVANDGGTALLWASSGPPCSALPTLIAKGADVKRRMPDGKTALHLIAARTVRRGDERCFTVALDALLNAGLDPAIRDNQGHTAYDIAVVSDNTIVAERLKIRP